jgi:hypothetical protein
MARVPKSYHLRLDERDVEEFQRLCEAAGLTANLGVATLIRSTVRGDVRLSPPAAFGRTTSPAAPPLMRPPGQ